MIFELHSGLIIKCITETMTYDLELCHFVTFARVIKVDPCGNGGR